MCVCVWWQWDSDSDFTKIGSVIQIQKQPDPVTLLLVLRFATWHADTCSNGECYLVTRVVTDCVTSSHLSDRVLWLDWPMISCIEYNRKLWRRRLWEWFVPDKLSWSGSRNSSHTLHYWLKCRLTLCNKYIYYVSVVSFNTFREVIPKKCDLNSGNSWV